MIRKTKEDYLRAIYHLDEEKRGSHPGVSSIDVSKYLGLSKSTVSEMLRKLNKEKLIRLMPYKKIRLTNKGIKESIDVTRKHRIIELFLSDILKTKKGFVHEEAHRLEHAFSDESINSIAKLVQDTNECPHGKPIPKMNKED